MGFMELQVERSTWVRWENTRGEGQMVEADLFSVDFLPMMRARAEKDLREITGALSHYTDGEPDPSTVEVVKGWCGRYSAPGYMDRTDWCGPFPTKREASEETIRLYGSDE